MKNTSTTNGFQLTTYSLLAASFLAVPQEAVSQLNHVDISPDALVTAGFWSSSTYELDLNDDGVDDIQLYAYRYVQTHSGAFYSRSYLSAFGLNSNIEIAQMGIAPGGDPFAQNINYGQIIGSSLLFAQDGVLHRSPYGNFLTGSGDAFIGYRTNETDGYHYGWIRVEVIDATSLYVKEYVYNTKAGQQVLAGEYCDPPTNLTSVVSGTSVTVSWDPATHADSYVAYGRKVGVLGFEKGAGVGTSIIIPPPLDNGTYEWTVKSVCAAGDYKSQLASPASFTIGPAPLMEPLRKRDHLKTE